MVKKIFTSLLILILLLSIAAGYFYLKKQKEYKEQNALKAVPINAELVIQFKNAAQLISKLRKNTGIWKELGHFKSIAKINQNLHDLDSLFHFSDKKRKFDLDRPFTIASLLTGKTQVDYLFIVPLNNFLEEKTLKNYIENLTGVKNRIKKRTYNYTTLYRVLPTKRGEKELNFTFSRGLFLISYSSILLEDAIRQLNSSSSITESKGFVQVQHTIGKNVDANIYLNLTILPKQIALLLDSKYRKHIRNFTRFANWAELDMTLRNNLLLFNGFSYSDPEQTNYLNIFLKQKPVKMKIESILPADAGLLVNIGIDDALLFKKQYRKYLEQAGTLSNYLKNINAIRKATGVDAEEAFYSILHKELALVFTDNQPKNRLVVIRTKSSSIASNTMLQLVKGYAKKQKRPLSSYTHHYQLDRETRFDIFQLPDNKLPYKLFGNLFSETSASYFTFIDNFLVLGPSVKSISGFIRQSVLGKTLANNSKYEQNKEYLSSKANFFFYTSTPIALPIIAGYLNDDLKTLIKTSRDDLSKFQAVGYQFSVMENMVYNNIFIRYDPILETPPQTDWESRLDTCFHHKPYLMKNHYTGENEILIQDLKNRLYLINSAGRILWKKPIPAQITGQIYQIDYYKNNKLQYLFVAYDRIYLIDRNGNNVENYPIQLKSPAVKGLALFDYDKNRNYRFFIPCKNKEIYAYSKEGKIVPGWKFGKTENSITGELQHFRVADKDYIVFSDKYRVYILNRKGQERVKLRQQFTKSEQNQFYLETANNLHQVRLVTTDPAGALYYCYFDGRVEKKHLDTFSKNHFFVSHDLDTDGITDYLFADGPVLKIFNEKGRKLLDRKFKTSIHYQPDIYTFSSRNKKIGLCMKEENRIYLINAKGLLHKGFPLEGNTKFSIGFTKKSDKTFNLFVGNRENFLLNYTVP